MERDKGKEMEKENRDMEEVVLLVILSLIL